MNVPAGWKLVPIEPTMEMSTAGERAVFDSIQTERKSIEAIKAKFGGLPAYRSVHHIMTWRAMLAAAPEYKGE